MEVNLEETMPAATTETVHALIFGKHDYIVNNVRMHLEKAAFKCSCTVSLAQALEYLKTNQPQLIVIGGGVDPHDRIKVQDGIKQWSPSTRMVEHFGGPATVLNEVREALNKF